MKEEVYSILFPNKDAEFKTLSDEAFHDLGLDVVVKELTSQEKEQKYIKTVLTRMTSDVKTCEFRSGVFEDVISNKEMREKMTELLDHVSFIKDFGSFKKEMDKDSGIWDLLHRIDDINDYIKSVEAMRECLSSSSIKSEGLLGLKKYIDEIYEDGFFEQLKKDIKDVKTDAASVQSITVGINLNQRFEANGIGLISINNKPFKKSGFISNFADAITSKDGINDGTNWKGDMHFHQVDPQGGLPMKNIEAFGGFMAMQSTPLVDNKVRSSIVKIGAEDSNSEVTYYMDKVAGKLIGHLVKRLREIMSKYVRVSIFNIINLIPEFMYYIRFAEYIEGLKAKGFIFNKATPVANEDGVKLMDAKDVYNIKLVKNVKTADEIVTNDLIFDGDNLVYILTGANRGGKTTITQAIGQEFLLAQGGIYVPAGEFKFVPLDGIFTHFPADEDKTLDLGRLGEECIRFKEMYEASTRNSLMLLNETFSTTSFEEGYYIARDSVRAILNKGVRTIYNTHMHKLGFDVDDLNLEEGIKGKAVSLVVKTEESKRSFKAVKCKPEGMSYAGDIASKYGVTYELLTGEA